MQVRAWLQQFRDVLDQKLFSIAGADVTIATLIAAALVFGATLWLAHLAEAGLRRAFKARGIGDEGTVGVAGRLIYYAVFVTGVAVTISTLGVPLSALFAAGAVAAVAIGFGLQNVLQNFISGILLLGERAIKPGDILEVEGVMVKVQHMGLRATIARTLDEEDIIIPNANLVQTSVKNLTLRDRLYRLRATVGVAYDSDLDRVFEVLKAAAKSHEERIDGRPPVVNLLGFGSSSVDFEVSIWLDDPWRARPATSRLNHLIWNALKAAHITIAFPQVDVHFDRPVVNALQARVESPERQFDGG